MVLEEARDVNPPDRWGRKGQKGTFLPSPTNSATTLYMIEVGRHFPEFGK